MTGPDAPDGTQVASIELWRVAMALQRPHRASHGTTTVRHLILVHVALADGTEGWGECSALPRPTYTEEYTEGAWMVLRHELAPAVLAGREIDVVGHPMAKAGMIMAVADALLRRVDRTLAVELAAVVGGNPARSMPVCAVISGRDRVDDVLAEVAARVEAGAAMVKLKSSGERADIAVVEAVRAAWPDLALAVDLNGSGTGDALHRLDRLGLRYIEQPAPARALVESAAMARRIGTPIALDESVGGADDLDACVALGAGAVVNVKPARCGGHHLATALVGRAVNAGLDVFVGGMVESGVGRAAALAVAAVPGCTLPTDLGPSSAYFDQDLTDPLGLDESGRILTPMGAGIGRAPRSDHLEQAASDRVLLRP